jgi:Kef-type K+ transport system membrane component KefB
MYPAGAPCDARNPTLMLFPTHTPWHKGPSNIRNYLNVCAQLGVVVFMFVVGCVL